MATVPDDPPIKPNSPVSDLETTTLKLPAGTLEFLRNAAAERGISTGDMARIALGAQKQLLEEVAKGAKVQLKRKDGTFDVSF